MELKYTRVDPDASYADLSAAVFGARGSTVVDSLLFFCQTGFCISYVIFILNNLAYIFPDVNPHGMGLMLMASLGMKICHPLQFFCF